MQGRKVELYRLSARSEELFSDVAEKLCIKYTILKSTT